MNVTEVMNLPEAQEDTEVLVLLKEINRKLEHIENAVTALEHRVEGVAELREDLWPMVQGASHALSRKLHELDQRGALAFARESLAVMERVATSFDEEDVRLLGENVVTILQTVRNLTQPEVMAVADRAALALKETGDRPDRKLGLLRAMRDPEVRRGMALLLTVLRELGAQSDDGRGVASGAAATA